MEAVFLIVLLAVLVGVVWWRLNAKKSAEAGRTAGEPEETRTGGTRTGGALSGGSAAASAAAAGTSGIASAAGFGRPAEPAPPTTADESAETAAQATASTAAAGPERGSEGPEAPRTAGAAGSPEAAARTDRRVQDDAEWETQWSEASGATPSHESAAHRDSATLHEGAPLREGAAHQDEAGGAPQPVVHHPEYTAPHAPTLPGAETAALEEPEDNRTEATASAAGAGGAPAAPDSAGLAVSADAAAAEIQDRTQSSALVETGADRTADQLPAVMSAQTGPVTTEMAPAEQGSTEPAGHLAAEEPYGAGSASAADDGSGPADYTVKGDAGGMVYYEEGHPEYEQARADVWFESPAHAEAAGFRAPRRRRI